MSTTTRAEQPEPADDEHPRGRERTIGEMIDDLGPSSLPLPLWHHADGAVIIFTGPKAGLPMATFTAMITAGQMTVPELIGLLEIAKRDLLSERKQDEALRAALMSP